MTRIVAAALMGMLACVGLGAAASGQEPPVVVVATAAGDVAAGPRAMPTSGLLRMAAGTLADAPPVSGFTGLTVVHVTWEFAGLLLARADLLRHERAERRQLPTFSGSLLLDSAPTSRFEQRVYVFRVLTPEH